MVEIERSVTGCGADLMGVGGASGELGGGSQMSGKVQQSPLCGAHHTSTRIYPTTLTQHMQQKNTQELG